MISAPRELRSGDSYREPHQTVFDTFFFSGNSLFRMSRALGWIPSQNDTSGESFQKRCRTSALSSSHLTGKLSRGPGNSDVTHIELEYSSVLRVFSF